MKETNEINMYAILHKQIDLMMNSCEEIFLCELTL